jgi:hypothetical protein
MKYVLQLLGRGALVAGAVYAMQVESNYQRAPGPLFAVALALLILALLPRGARPVGQ